MKTSNSENKTFIQLNQNAEIVCEFSSKTPRAAALKAATRNEEREIIIVDAPSGKIHFFRGSRLVLTESQRNSFTEAKNIQTRPTVQKMAYESLNRSINVKKDKDILKSLIQIKLN